MRTGIFIFLFLIIAGTAPAQTLFLPQSLNTTKQDHPVDFAEYQGAYYFVGTQWPTQVGKASSGFCYKTDSAGNVLQTFQLNGLDSTRGYSFDAVYGYDDQIYVVATVGDFRNESYLLPPRQGDFSDGYSYNKILVLRFNRNLNLNRADTLQYDTDSSDIQVLKSVRIGSRIFTAYTGLGKPDTAFNWRQRSFITVYSTDNSSFTHQPIDSSFLASVGAPWGIIYGSQNFIMSLTTTGDDQLLLGCGLSPYNFSEAANTALQLDTNLTITYLPFAVNYTVSSNVFFSQEYLELWRPTSNSSYFAGPLFFQQTSSQWPPTGYGFSSIARLDSLSQTIVVGTQAVQRYPQRESYRQSSKKPMTLLRDKVHFIVSGQASVNWDPSHRPDSAYIWVSKYDTGLNLLWTRNFEKPGHYFEAAGVHELQNGKLMVIAAATDTLLGNTQDLYCFIIDSNGTPLNAFNVAAPASKIFRLYPNPAQEELYITPVQGQNLLSYRVLDMQGKVLLEGPYRSGSPIAVQVLPPASYILQVEGSDRSWQASHFTKQ